MIWLYVIDSIFSIDCGWLGVTFLSHYFPCVKRLLMEPFFLDQGFIGVVAQVHHPIIGSLAPMDKDLTTSQVQGCQLWSANLGLFRYRIILKYFS